MKEEINQALSMHTDFFDPIHASARVKMNPSNLVEGTVYYKKEQPCVVVSNDRTVEFSFQNCNAKSVAVSGFGGNFSSEKIYLQSDGRGNFYKKIKNFPAGMHYYRWFIDGVQVCHPKAGVNYGCFQAVNTFEVPEPGVDFYYVKPVVHGRVRMCKYHSHVNGHLKQCYVYTPPSYDEDSERRYPVLYLQHGVGENETSWIWQGKCNFIMDNLISDRKCEDMIVVMCSGYAFREGEDPVFYPGDFDREWVEDVIPLIDQKFRTIRNRSGRAIAGLSLGSAQATLTATKHPSLFCALGIFSGISTHLLEDLIDKPEKMFPTVFLSCGSYEGGLCEAQEALIQKIKSMGLSGNYLQKSYTGYHEWHVWRKSLYDFVPLLFHEVNKELEPFIVLKQEEVFNYNKQSLQDSAVFFDPVYKQVVYAVDENGNPAGKYCDVRKGVEIGKDGKVTLSIYAPGAKSVVAEIFDGEKRVLFPEKEVEGMFSDTISTISEGVHYVQFLVNGVEVVNPNAPISLGCYRTINYFEIPEKELECVKFADIPHGDISMNYYRSTTTNRLKLCYIYTPPNYQDTVEQKYPVLYLQHGGGDNELGWLYQGSLAEIADRLIFEKKMKPMIIVCNAGYVNGDVEQLQTTFREFGSELIQDCIPYVDQNYRTISSAEGRGIAGVSMGGIQAQNTAFLHPDQFGWVATFSGGFQMEYQDEEERIVSYPMEKACNRLHKVFVACGTKDIFYDETIHHVQMAKEKGAQIDTFFEEGSHDWTFWRHALIAFLPKLWQEE